MLGINSRSSCREWFKKLEILPIPSSYMYSLILFVVHNLHYFHANSSVHDINTNIRIIYIYLHLDLLLYREVLTILLVRYSTNYHLESQDLK